MVQYNTKSYDTVICDAILHYYIIILCDCTHRGWTETLTDSLKAQSSIILTHLAALAPRVAQTHADKTRTHSQRVTAGTRRESFYCLARICSLLFC